MLSRHARLVSLLVWTACGSVSSHAPDAGADDPIVAVVVSPDTLALQRGFDAPKQLTATATHASAATEDVTATAVWSTSDPAIASVAAGLVAPIAAGSATITATVGGRAGSATLTATTAQMIVAETSAPGLSFWDAFQTGNSAPLRRITGAATTLSFPWSVVVHNNEIYVADLVAGEIAVFPLAASGNVAPTRKFSVPNPLALAIANDEIYTATNDGTTSKILVYPTGANGNVQPTRTITGAATKLLAEVNGIAIVGNEMFVSSEQQGAVNIVVLPLDANGNTAAKRVISGAATKLFDIWDIRVAAGEIFVAELAHAPNPDPGIPGGTQAIQVFAATADGNVAPVRELGGAQSGITSPLPIQVLGDELYTLNFGTSASLVVHPRTASGDTAPTRTLAGPATGISAPRGIAFY